MKRIKKLFKKIFTKKKQVKKHNNFNFDEEEWRDEIANALYGEAHYSCGDKD